jgi:peptide/nickel transport system substrate-binding protein
MTDHQLPADAASREGHTRADLLRRAAAGGALLATGAVPGLAAQAAGAAPLLKRGGNFRVAIGGGSDAESIDAQNSVLDPDAARLAAMFEGLMYYDSNYKVQPLLAEEFSSKDAVHWTIRVRKGIEFHNGKTLTADDVVFSIQRMLTKSLGLYATSQIAGSVTRSGIKKMDKYTVRLTLASPNAVLPEAFGQYFMNIVPVGYKGIKAGGKQIGTGPYTFKSFTPGVRSVHMRNPNYWQSGKPYFDQLTIIDIPDDNARVNALLGGQVDAIAAIPFPQISSTQGKGFKILNSETGGWVPITMAVDQPPFNDVRVRQAFRLIADRPTLVKVAYSGYGHVGNDVYSPLDACYSNFPQRTQDIEKAKSLLAAAGQSNLTVDLPTTEGRAGQTECCVAFAQMASKAGVTINVKKLDGTTFYGSQYLKYPFATDYWGTRNYLNQVAAGSLPNSPYNETHWNDAKFNALYKQALKTTSEGTRCAIVHEMQKIEYDTGGYIVWGFYNLVDAYSPKVTGFAPSKGTLPLGSYGNSFKSIAFA